MDKQILECNELTMTINEEKVNITLMQNEEVVTIAGAQINMLVDWLGQAQIILRDLEVRD